MAGYGRTTIQTEYPPFDSWHYRDDGTYVHNTTGITSKERPRQAVLQYFKPSAAGPKWVDMDDGGRCLTLASVRTLQIDEDGFYFSIQDGNRVIRIADQLIYDQEAETVGRMHGLEWQIERGEPSKKRRKWMTLLGVVTCTLVISTPRQTLYQVPRYLSSTKATNRLLFSVSRLIFSEIIMRRFLSLVGFWSHRVADGIAFTISDLHLCHSSIVAVSPLSRMWRHQV